MNQEKLKATVPEKVDNQYQQLKEIALKIHDSPELSLNEVKAARWLTEYLEENGFSVERGICGLPTAFRARYGKNRPTIAFLAEYDALPGVGHACGHNLIAAIAVGAGVASQAVIDKLGGSVLVIGTPAEERGGGKIIMAEKGAFANLDAAMMVHPGPANIDGFNALAAQHIEVEFLGKSAHAAALPEQGINALEAMIQSFNAINSLRQHIRSSARISGIITDGGNAPNVVPEHSAASFLVRATEDDYLGELKQKVINCFAGAATATGAQLKYKCAGKSYDTMRNNSVMTNLFVKNTQTLGREFTPIDPLRAFGSTDMGNVSHVVPSIHPFIAITGPEVAVHSPEFATAAASEAGIKGMLDASKGLAMTAIDLVANPELLKAAREEFEEER